MQISLDFIVAFVTGNYIEQLCIHSHQHLMADLEPLDSCFCSSSGIIGRLEDAGGAATDTCRFDDYDSKGSRFHWR
ncbi:hypothetical protein ACSBR1_003006 [Camellia fascicularis]